MSRFKWVHDAQLELNGGMRHSSRGDLPAVFKLEVRDKTSGLFVVELTFNGDQLMELLSGRHGLVIDGELATLALAHHWNCVPTHETILVPPEVTKGVWQQDKGKQLALEWYEDQPGSGEVDNYRAHYQRESNNSERYVIITTVYVPKAEHDEAVRLQEESEEPDYDDDGLDEEYTGIDDE